MVYSSVETRDLNSLIMTKYGRIYIIRNTINSKVYVGLTKVSIKLRFLNHLSAARCGKDYVIGKAIRKYGEENFYIELLEECLVEELNDREIYWIDFFNSTNNKFGYNMSKGGHVPITERCLDKSLIIDMFMSGKPAYQIAKILHTEIAKVTKVLRDNNIEYGLSLLKTPEHIIDIAQELYLKGYSTLDVLKHLCINKSIIRRRLIDRGIKMRTFKETKNLRRNLPTLPKAMPHESLAVTNPNSN